MGKFEIKEMQLQGSIAVSFIIFEVPVCFPHWSLGSGYNTQKVWIRTAGRHLSTLVIGSFGLVRPIKSVGPSAQDLNKVLEHLRAQFTNSEDINHEDLFFSFFDHGQKGRRTSSPLL